MNPRDLPPGLRDYLIACVRAAPPSKSRDEALALLGDTHMVDQQLDSVWSDIEREAERQGCTIADVIFDRAGRSDPDPDPDPV